MRLVIYSIFLSLPIFGYAFPENIRHGYFSCTSCHVSPSGGGVLTPYGRSLSAELMSTWGSPKSSGFLFSDSEDESKNPPWFRANIFTRGVQTRRDSPTVEKTQFIPMQGDLEAGVDIEQFAAIVTMGYRARYASQSKDLGELFSRRHYLLYRPSENVSVRAGKFMFSFGLNGPDHITATRRGLGWDQGSESYNLELSYLSEKISSILTWIDNSPEELNLNKDKGFSINQSSFIGDDSKIGLSAFAGGQPNFDKYVIGPYWILSINKYLFLESEIFFQKKRIKLTSLATDGYATFHRLGYEAYKGFIPFLQFDRSYLDNSEPNSQFDSYGLGAQWLPYPHFEFMLFAGKEKSYSKEATDFAWLMLNLYL